VRRRPGLALVLGALLAALLPAAVPGAAAAPAGGCATEGAKVSYAVAYDEAAKADVIRGVAVAGLPIACVGRTLVVVLTKNGVAVDYYAGIVVIGKSEGEIICTGHEGEGDTWPVGELTFTPIPPTKLISHGGTFSTTLPSVTFPSVPAAYVDGVTIYVSETLP
jgi:hypothetical protein